MGILSPGRIGPVFLGKVVMQINSNLNDLLTAIFLKPANLVLVYVGISLKINVTEEFC